jgi:2-keto-4-pentenoate hydratase/2-oxohepta-3-ene-1,7-dioic acid hydratase in catechol pathway
MRLALADVPSPFLAEERVIAQGPNGTWHDFAAALRQAGIAGAPTDSCDLPHALSFLAAEPAATRRRIERALDADRDALVGPMLKKPLQPLSKILLTEGSIALSRSNDQRPANMVVGFSKFATSLADPEATISLPDIGARYDVEAALAAVIGRGGNRFSRAAAERSIVGWTLMAEVTHRDMFETEARTNNSLFAKNCLGLTPLGPAIAIGALGAIEGGTEITLRVNGAVRQRFTLGDFAHEVADAVRAWSRVVLEPGDMVALGAAICRPRAGNEVDSPIPIAPGDRIEVACPAIGVLRAHVKGA